MKPLAKMNRRLGVVLALVGFMTVMVMGVSRKGEFKRIIGRSLAAMVLGYVTGRAVGLLAERLISEVVPPLPPPEQAKPLSKIVKEVEESAEDA